MIMLRRGKKERRKDRWIEEIEKRGGEKRKRKKPYDNIIDFS